MEQTGLIWVDWCIIGFIALSGIISLWRGFIRECISVVIWVLAIIVAWLFADPLAKTFDGVIASYAVRFTISVIILALGVLIIGALLNMLIGKLVTLTGFSFSDRIVGVVFGILRGGVVVTIVVGILVYMPVQGESWWQRSVMIPKFEQLAAWSKGVVVNKVRPLLNKDMPGISNDLSHKISSLDKNSQLDKQ